MYPQISQISTDALEKGQIFVRNYENASKARNILNLSHTFQ